MDFIEFLDGDARGHARTRCVVTPEIERSVACRGFAAEYYLLKNGYAEKDPEDDWDINRIVFHNATNDREDFWGRKLGSEGIFSKEEDQSFMNYAIEFVTPIFDQYFSGMQELAHELSNARRVEGKQVRKLLRPWTPR